MWPDLAGKILFHRTFTLHSTHRMFIWTPDRIRSIAPDENTWERARRLAHPPVWRNQSGNEAMVWGECKGSGGSFYQTAIDWNGPAYRCSCPVKRMPCKHILALMLLLHNYSDHFRVTHDLPDWAEQWRAARLKRQAKPASPEQEADRSAQREKKRDQRLDVMAAGIEALDKWLRDMVRQGIAEAENRPASFWEQTAARMTDAKLGSIARRLRMLAFPAAGQSRHLQLLNELGDLFLLVEAFRKLDHLPEGMQQDVLTACGIAQRKSDLDGQPGISDRWVVMGQEEGEEEQLRFRKVWLWGLATRRFALLLDFAWGDTGFEGYWPTGAVFAGEMCYFPSQYPQRAVARAMSDADISDHNLLAYNTLLELANEYARALALQPWLPQMPALLDAVVPVLHDGKYWLADRERKSCTVVTDDLGGRKLLAVSGGHPVSLFGVWDAGSFRVLSVVSSPEDRPPRIVQW